MHLQRQFETESLTKKSLLWTPRMEPTQYTVNTPLRFQGEEVSCPVLGCPYKIERETKKSKRMSLKKQFQSLHIEDSIMIEEEANCRNAPGGDFS